jgi:hypothetical protein
MSAPTSGKATVVARLAVAEDFSDDWSKLEETVRSTRQSAIDKFAAHTCRTPSRG